MIIDEKLDLLIISQQKMQTNLEEQITKQTNLEKSITKELLLICMHYLENEIKEISHPIS